MGCSQSAPADNSGKQRNDEIETQLKKDRALMRNEIKMLLLGKTTEHSMNSAHFPCLSVADETQVRESLESRRF